MVVAAILEALEKRRRDFYIQINGDDQDPPTYARDKFKSAIPPSHDLLGPAYQFRSVGDANLYMCLWTSMSSIYPLVRQLQIRTMTDMPDCLRSADLDPR
ncbi:hypothetical protein N7492_009458 [Penicillium capsulatum]|uniref:Uncharacterized protein n=1 Tax=Penicillium capsulatum TaxID=69766 RepID=A0A9W9LIA2_9EURO|nr:hypothetical protein N7492_009458 [Penicillium capsulatum]